MARTYRIVKNRAEEIIKIVLDQIPAIKSIEFDIINNYDFNAFAMGSGGNYFIGINRGTIATLLIIYDRLLVDKQFMPFIGDINLESDGFPLMDNITMNYAKMVGGLEFFGKPKDPLRNFYAGHLVKQSLDFILAHEISHIVHGHVDYIKSEFNLQLDELNFSRNKIVDYNLFSKVIELDADEGAANTLLGSELMKVLNKRPRPEKLENLYKSPGMILLQFSICSSIIFKIFGDQRLSNIGFIKERYPRPRLRNAITLLAVGENYIFKQLQEKMKFDLDSFNIPISAKAGFDSVEKDFERITGKKSNEESIKDAWGKIGIDQINVLRNEWNTNLRDKLQNYAFIKLSDKQMLKNA
jgi:hypothetical protein